MRPMERMRLRPMERRPMERMRPMSEVKTSNVEEIELFFQYVKRYLIGRINFMNFSKNLYPPTYLNLRRQLR